jgi:hypothetical protein
MVVSVSDKGDAPAFSAGQSAADGRLGRFGAKQVDFPDVGQLNPFIGPTGQLALVGIYVVEVQQRHVSMQETHKIILS